jgi:hypothetical protein
LASTPLFGDVSACGIVALRQVGNLRRFVSPAIRAATRAGSRRLFGWRSLGRQSELDQVPKYARTEQPLMTSPRSRRLPPALRASFLIGGFSFLSD